MTSPSNPRADVGPVLTTGSVAQAVLAAIRELNADVRVLDRGAYLRVLVPGRCVATREAIEKHLGRAFTLPADLEKVMPALQGNLEVTSDGAVWSASAGETNHPRDDPR